jgi:hypothetical protein
MTHYPQAIWSPQVAQGRSYTLEWQEPEQGADREAYTYFKDRRPWMNYSGWVTYTWDRGNLFSPAVLAHVDRLQQAAENRLEETVLLLPLNGKWYFWRSGRAQLADASGRPMLSLWVVELPTAPHWQQFLAWASLPLPITVPNTTSLAVYDREKKCVISATLPTYREQERTYLRGTPRFVYSHELVLGASIPTPNHDPTAQTFARLC